MSSVRIQCKQTENLTEDLHACAFSALCMRCLQQRYDQLLKTSCVADQAPGASDAAKQPQGPPRGNDARRGGNLTNAQRDHRRKDTNKAAVGNHHRKDRALRKAGAPVQS